MFRIYLDPKLFGAPYYGFLIYQDSGLLYYTVAYRVTAEKSPDKCCFRGTLVFSKDSRLVLRQAGDVRWGWLVLFSNRSSLKMRLAGLGV